MRRIKKMVDDLSKAYQGYAVGCCININNYGSKDVFFLCVQKGTCNVIYAKHHHTLKELTAAANKLLENK
jgi:hypothetical protein